MASRCWRPAAEATISTISTEAPRSQMTRRAEPVVGALAREGVLVVDGDEDGLLAAGVRGDLDVGRAVGHAADPVDGLVAEARLDLGEDLGQAVEGGAGA